LAESVSDENDEARLEMRGTFVTFDAARVELERWQEGEI
jgi:hypothetical protein